jgi:hypothetical protein
MTILRRFLIRFITLAMLCAGFALPPAYAGMVATDEAASQSERERVKDMIARPEVAKKLEALGVSPQEAAARVDALTPAELSTLAAKIDTLPAGGISDTNLLWVVVAIILLIILL